MEEKRFLKYNWGELTLEQLSQKLNRTPAAIVDKAFHLKLGSANKGTFTLTDVIRKSGYDVGRIRTAIKALGIRAKRRHRSDVRKLHSKEAWFALTDEQVQKILDFLATIPDGEPLWLDRPKHGEWGKHGKPKKCERCRRTDRPHKASGYCNACHIVVVKGAWGVRGRTDSCIVCGGSDRPHAANNVCSVCYNRNTRANNGGKLRVLCDITARCGAGNPASICSNVGVTPPRKRGRPRKQRTPELTEVASGG